MKSLWRDTDPETEAYHIRLLRKATVSRRFRLVRSLTASAIGLSRKALACLDPDASTEEIGLRWVGLHYGAELERELRRFLEERRRR